MRFRTCHRPGMGLPALLSVLALVVLLTPLPAQAELEVGAEAPDVVAKDFINIEPISLSKLSGRLILLELFSTT